MWHRPGNGATRRPASAAGFPRDSSSDSARFLAPSFLLLSRYIVNDERPDIRTLVERFRVKVHRIRVPSTGTQLARESIKFPGTNIQVFAIGVFERRVSTDTRKLRRHYVRTFRYSPLSEI